jgi:hypothetical protein
MLAWAERNLESLKSAHEAFRRKKPYGLRREENIEWTVIPTLGDGDSKIEGSFVVYITVAEGLRPIEDLALRVGDIIHNMRVALDYLAYGVAIRYNPSFVADRKKSFGIQFPICGKSENWLGLKNKIKLDEWASPEAVKWFERLQPYNRPNAANLDPLLLLHKLDNPHKHRNLLAAAPNVTAVDFTAVDPFSAFEPVSFGLEGPFKDGAVVARGKFVRLGGVRSPAERDTKAKVHIDVAFEIAFDDAGPAPRYPVFELLDEIADFIRSAAFPALEPHI